MTDDVDGDRVVAPTAGRGRATPRRRRTRRPRPVGSDPRLDARRIVERASGLEGAELVLGLDEAATERGVHFFDVMVERRLAGEPLQYVLGRWGFRTLDLSSTPGC